MPSLLWIEQITLYHSLSCWQDYMVNAMNPTPGSRKTVYVGDFVGFKYDGTGSMFLPDASIDVLGARILLPEGFPVFEGEFAGGKPVRGIIKSPIRGGSVAWVEFDEAGNVISVTLL